METIVTHGNVKILRYFNIREKQFFHRNVLSYHTGVDIQCKEVYSGFPGTVVYIGKPDLKTSSVIVQYNDNNAFAYCNLKGVNVRKGDIVDTDDLIGTCVDFVHIEYLTTAPENKFRVMLTKQMFYKQDPLDILLNGYESFIDYPVEVAVSQAFLRNLTIESEE